MKTKAFFVVLKEILLKQITFFWRGRVTDCVLVTLPKNKLRHSCSLTQSFQADPFQAIDFSINFSKFFIRIAERSRPLASNT